MKVGDLVKIVQYHIGYETYVGKIGVIVCHSGSYSKVRWNDGAYSSLLRDTLVVISESR